MSFKTVALGADLKKQVQELVGQSALYTPDLVVLEGQVTQLVESEIEPRRT